MKDPLVSQCVVAGVAAAVGAVTPWHLQILLNIIGLFSRIQVYFVGLFCKRDLAPLNPVVAPIKPYVLWGAYGQ